MAASLGLYTSQWVRIFQIDTSSNACLSHRTVDARLKHISHILPEACPALIPTLETRPSLWNIFSAITVNHHTTVVNKTDNIAT